jgi:hypothetical protein
MRRLSAILTLGLVANAFVACGPPPRKPKPVEAPEPPPPPPPPPKCESLEENCKATSSTKARIPGVPYVVTPPPGWTYAQTDAALIATAESGGVVVLTAISPVEPAFKLTKQRADKFQELAELVSVKPRRRQVLLSKPTIRKEIVGVEASLWQRPGATRPVEDGDDVRGAILVVSVPLEEKNIFGFGFAGKDDGDSTKAVFEAILSIREAKAESAQPEDTPDETDDSEASSQ